MVLAVVPSRFHSSRFPGKALVPICGRPLVRRVVDRVIESRVADAVVVATDDERIAAAVAGSGAEVARADGPYRSGSDRVAAVARSWPDAGRVLNVQGDEPLVSAELLRAALSALEGREIGTVATRAGDPIQLADEDVVKVSCEEGLARDFSRTPEGPARARYAHLGVYAFSTDSLARFAELPTGRRERAERLEQLRALERGWRIGVAVTAAPIASINRVADVGRVDALLRAG